MAAKTPSGALWVATESAILIYLQGRYLPPLFLVGKALAYPLLNSDKARSGARAAAEWIRLVDVMRRKHPALHRRLQQATVDALGAVFVRELPHRAVFAAGRAVRNRDEQRAAGRKKPRVGPMLGSFFLSLFVQQVIGWPADYCNASIAAAQMILPQLAATAAEDRDVLNRVIALAGDVAEVLQQTTFRKALP